jgi:hypothetical protein
MNNNILNQKIRLPEGFHEKIILREIRFNSGDRAINLIRELVYLYMVIIINQRLE